MNAILYKEFIEKIIREYFEFKPDVELKLDEEGKIIAELNYDRD